jgi:hypothetical protein
MLGIRRNPTIVAADKLKPLGTVGGSRYVEHRGREYVIGSTVERPDQGSAPDDGIVISTPVTADNGDGRMVEIDRTYTAAWAVPPGTYAAEVERRSKRTRPAPLRPADALDGLSLLARRSDRIVPSGGGPALGVELKPQGYASGRPAIRGRAILALLGSRGVQLQVRDGRLLPLSEQRIAPGMVEIIDKAARLLIGYVTRHPVPCELEHKDKAPEAVTLLVGGLAACEQHRSGGLRP